ncbi:MAG: hypothetical protein R3Y54_09255 [Eubacteriales bacterium]
MSTEDNYHNQKETNYIKETIENCENLEDLKERVFPLLCTQRELWASKINQILTESNHTKTSFALTCGVSRVTLDKWCKGALPRNRETFMRIGMVAQYDIEQMNQFLQRYGQYPALYSKSLEDCICMHVLRQKNEKGNYEQYRYILDRMKEIMIRREEDDLENITTYKFDEQINRIESQEELENFIADNTAIFSYAYHKLYATIKICLNSSVDKYNSSIFEIAMGQEWSSSLRQCVSSIRQNKWYPTRNKIISLGLHLCMDHEQIDELLGLAHMEPLCAKNIFESVILFILVDASLKNMCNKELEEFDPDGLCQYAGEVLIELDLPEINGFLSELSKDEEEE